MRITSRLLAAAIFGGLALALAPVSFGGQPVTQPLNPEPPSFYACKAVGAGTVCQGTQTEVIAPQPDSFVCPDGGIVYDQGTVETDAIRYYDGNGDLTRRVLHQHWTDAQKSNPLNGLTAPYTQSSIITDVLAVPGDFSSATETVTGAGIVTLPGYGAIFMPAGRSVTDPDGVTVFQAGPPAFVAGTAYLPLCAALGA
jgi:hypothetical protein